MNQNMLLIPEKLAQILVDYLANRPYGEVFQLIPGLMGLKPAPIDEPKPDEDGKAEAPSA